MRTRGGAAGAVRLLLLTLAAVPDCGPRRAPAAAAPGYTDVTAAAGLDHVSWCGSPAKEHLLESVGSGGAFLDLDGDGRDDVFLLDAWRLEDRPAAGGARGVVSRGRFAFYHNRGDGTFEDRTEAAGLGGGGAWGLGVAAGDIDGDGDVDLLVTCFGPDLLYRNRGDGTFEEVAERAGVADPGWGGGAAFFDADGDGDLDLYVTNYIDAGIDQVLAAERTLSYKGEKVMVGPFGLPGGFDHFYRNRGDGTFAEASEETGLVDRAQGYGLGVLAADLDGDGDVNLYVANDSNPNYLFRNEGSGRFSEIGVVSGAAFDAKGAAQASMGVAVLDYDRDGILDLFTTNFADDASTLYRGEGKLFFSDVAEVTGVGPITYRPLSWGTLPTDFDLDGWTDLVVADGHIYPQVDTLAEGLRYRQTNLLLAGRAGGFDDASARAGPGFAVSASFRGAAAGDIDGDGDEDLLFTRIDQTALLLRHGGGDPRQRIVVQARKPYPLWFGARVDVVAGGKSQSRVILSGSSFASQGALRAVFGLGGAAKAEQVRVRFAGGGEQTFKDVPGGTVLTVDVPGAGGR